MRPLPRIIPSLLIKDNNLVKTVNFDKYTYIGDPINAIKIFNEKEVDELFINDISATTSNTEPNFDLLEKIARECRMPLCYTGGIKNTLQAEKIIHLGVEKIGISSSIFSNEDFISILGSKIGKQSVVVILDIRFNDSNNSYKVYTHNGKFEQRLNVDDLLKDIIKQQPGEIVFNSIDRDGTLLGYDENILEKYAKNINCPLTILGGANSYIQMKKIIKKYGNIGFGVGSKFVLNGKFKAVLISYLNKIEKENIFN